MLGKRRFEVWWIALNAVMVLFAIFSIPYVIEHFARTEAGWPGIQLMKSVGLGYRLDAAAVDSAGGVWTFGRENVKWLAEPEVGDPVLEHYDADLNRLMFLRYTPESPRGPIDAACAEKGLYVWGVGSPDLPDGRKGLPGFYSDGDRVYVEKRSESGALLWESHVFTSMAFSDQIKGAVSSDRFAWAFKLEAGKPGSLDKREIAGRKGRHSVCCVAYAPDGKVAGQAQIEAETKEKWDFWVEGIIPFEDGWLVAVTCIGKVFVGEQSYDLAYEDSIAVAYSADMTVKAVKPFIGFRIGKLISKSGVTYAMGCLGEYASLDDMKWKHSETSIIVKLDSRLAATDICKRFLGRAFAERMEIFDGLLICSVDSGSGLVDVSDYPQLRSGGLFLVSDDFVRATYLRKTRPIDAMEIHAAWRTNGTQYHVAAECHSRTEFEHVAISGPSTWNGVLATFTTKIEDHWDKKK